MIDQVMFQIKNNKMLYEYLLYHSYWYKSIKRGDYDSLRNMIQNMKEEYKLTTKDKIDDIQNKIILARNILEIFN